MKALSQELLDCIIDFLWEDKKSLIACSTICADWSDAARFHILERLVISSEERLELLQHSTTPLRFTQKLRLRTVKALDYSCWPRLSNATHLRIHHLEAASSQLDHMVQPFFNNFTLLTRLTIRRCKLPSLHTFMQAIHSLPDCVPFAYITLIGKQQ